MSDIFSQPNQQQAQHPLAPPNTPGGVARTATTTTTGGVNAAAAQTVNQQHATQYNCASPASTESLQK